MNKILTMALLTVLTVGLLSSSDLYATGFGMNITIPDRMGSGTGWYGAQEDNEVEPGCVTGHIWDLEAFFIEGLKLTMVGTIDFQNGIYYAGNGKTYRSGDIFIDVDGNVKYGPPNDGSGKYKNEVANTSGYDYVFDIDFSNLSYNLYEINSNTKVIAIVYAENQESNPWIYSRGAVRTVASGTATYKTGLLDSEVGGLNGGGLKHNALTVDLSPISSYFHNNTVTFHNTYECGNDNLMGAIPEPGTLLLFGAGLLGLGVISRLRRYGKKEQIEIKAKAEVKPKFQAFYFKISNIK